jgi:hypothetical protein
MSDQSAIVAVVQDYWEGWFDGDVERMRRALHPGLAKTGVATTESGGQSMELMTADDMIGWTRDGEGIARKPADFTYEVIVNDSYHEIATVTVRSAIYREYLHLVRTGDGWKILNALYAPVR